MGALFGLIFIDFVAILGLILLTCGIAGVIIFPMLSKKGFKAGVMLSVLSGVSIGAGAIIVILAASVYSPLLWISDEPYVPTDIVIEEEGYQAERFTADGIVYVAVDLYVNYDIYEERNEPVFSYKAGKTIFSDNYERGNYYRVENDMDFDLVCDCYYTLFCPEEQKDSVLTYYLEQTDILWYTYNYDYDYDFNLFNIFGEDDDENLCLPDNLQQPLTEFIRGVDKVTDDKIEMSLGAGDEYVIYYIEAVSSDKVISYNGAEFCVTGDNVYYVLYSEYSGTLVDEYLYTLVEIPESFEAELGAYLSDLAY